MGTSGHEILFILVFFACYKANAVCKEEAFVNKEIVRQQSGASGDNVRPSIGDAEKRRYRRGYPVVDGGGNGSFSGPAFSAVRLMRSKLSEFMAADPRIEPNVSWSRPHETYYGGINTEQKNRKKVDNFKKVLEYRNNQRGASKFDKGTECDFEGECKWTWQDNRFSVTTGNQMGDDESGLRTDGDNNEKGHFLMVRLKPSSSNKETDWNWTITSPMFDPVGDNCRIQFLVFQSHMNDSVIRIVLHNINKTQVMVDQILGTNTRRWTKYEKVLGKSTQKFTVMLEVVPGKNNRTAALVAFDNIKLLRCYPENANSDVCTPNQYRCAANNVCINNSEICDITRDCIGGDDEMQNCDKIPMGARCNFEQDWCGWYNAPGKPMDWTRHNGSTATNATTGPKIDHTYGNVTGKYLHVTVATTVDALFASTATLNSIIFNPPPKVHGNLSSVYYNSCMIRFYLHQKGNHKSAFSLQVTELKPKENTSTELLWSYDNYDDEWRRQVIVLPNITHRYFLHFDIRKGIRYVKDIAIDDLSLSPECFGLNIPASELNGYDYYNPERPTTLEPHKNFVNETYYEVKTCNATGRYGPTQDNCTNAYSGTPVNVKVLRETGLNGVQKWTVPSEGYYTFILYGASGGKGSGAMGSSRGSMVRAVLDLRKGQEIYMLVGQEGTSACVKSLGNKANSSCKSLTNYKNFTGIRGILTMELEDGGGGGGGGTFVFLRNKMKRPIPLAVAAGGGGLGLGVFVDTGLQHGHGINHSMPGITGRMFGQKSAGAGGGWSPYLGQIARDHESRQGQALLTGGIGGEACYQSTDGRGDGGFGGGGGGCITGGGGGGYSGILTFLYA